MNHFLNQFLAIGGRINQAKDRFGKGRMRDGQHALDEALKVVNAEIKELQQRPEAAEEDVWRE